jgi:hypothetical protein
MRITAEGRELADDELDQQGAYGDHRYTIHRDESQVVWRRVWPW